MREQGTLLGEAGKDILLGWFASGLIFIPLWIIGDLMVRGLMSLTKAFGAKFDVSSPEGWDTLIFLCDAVAIGIAFSTLIALRRRYPYLTWSCGLGMLLFCLVWSFAIEGFPTRRG